MRFKHLASREYLTVVPFGLACDVPAFKHEGVGPKPIHLSNVTEHVSCFFVCLFICSLFVYSYVRLLISLFVCLFVCLFIRLTGEYLEEGLVLQIVWIYQVISSEKWRFLDTDSQNELRLIWNK